MEWQIFTVGMLLSIIGTMGLIILNSMRKSVDIAGESVNELNVKVAVVIERIEYHDERIKRLEEKERISL
jgi:hypothetical protein